MRKTGIALLVTMFLLVTVTGVAFAITFGEPDSDHPHVGLVGFFDEGGNWMWRCSGTLLSDTVFLTAGHCTSADCPDNPDYAPYSAMESEPGVEDLGAGDPWFLKRFYVDGHEYNVVAIKTVPADTAGGEDFEFKYITIRTPVPKVNFVNNQDSQKLEGYYLGMVHGEDTSIISVMPPYNFSHTRLNDIQKLQEGQFADDYYYEGDCMGDLEFDVDPLVA